MSTLLSVACLIPPVLAFFGLGYVVGFERGDDAGYRLGYQDGEVDERLGLRVPRVPVKPRHANWIRENDRA